MPIFFIYYNGYVMRLSYLKSKTIINYLDGKNLGNIIDAILDEKGKIIGLVIEKKKFLISFFTNKKEMTIKWDQIEKIGEDVILVSVAY